MVIGLIYGMSASFISLFMSKWMAKRSMGVHIIETPSSNREKWLIDTVKRLSKKAGIGMPEVGIFQSDAPNAFATGANRNSSLVAVSTGLMHAMTEDEVEAVLGHEIGHVANGDMVTQTLLQGVLNAFVFVLARLIGTAISSLMRGNDNRGESYGMGFYLGTFIAQIVLGFLAQIILMWFSRYREYRADIAGAQLSGRENMINALRRLGGNQKQEDLPNEMAAFGISGSFKKGFAHWFSTHPPLEDRIAALQSKRYG